MKKLIALVLVLLLTSSPTIYASDNLSGMSDAQLLGLIDEYQILSEKIGGGKDAVILYQEKQQALWDAYKNDDSSVEGYQWELAALRTEYKDSLSGTTARQIKEAELWIALVTGKKPIDDYTREMEELRVQEDNYKAKVGEYQIEEEALWGFYTSGSISVDEYNDKLMALRTEYCLNNWSPEDLATMQARQSEIRQEMLSETSSLITAPYVETKAVNMGYTLAQLQTEYLAILEAMWKTKEWQKVEVPAGVYEVGVEIPAGEWTLSNDTYFTVHVGTKLDATKTQIDWDNRTAGEFVDIEDFKNGWTVVLTSGDYIEISDVVFFTVPVKGQGFTFK